MLFVLLLVLALIFLPSPWDLVLIACAAVLEVGLWVGGVRYSRHRRAQVGVHTLVGTVGEALSPLAPTGQVKVDGEIWEARSSAEILPGEPVRVTAVDGLTLEVERDP
jgi:membrane-bound serine protease (ClpP class)